MCAAAAGKIQPHGGGGAGESAASASESKRVSLLAGKVTKKRAVQQGKRTLDKNRAAREEW